MKTIENVTLINKFMGLNLYCPDGIQDGSAYGYSNLYIINEGQTNWHTCYAQDFKYNSSWDSLMPVVEKIELIGCTEIFDRPTYSDFWFRRNSVEIRFSKDGQYLFNLDYKLSLKATYKHSMYKTHVLKAYDFKNNSLITAVYDATIEFLNWYYEHFKSPVND